MDFVPMTRDTFEKFMAVCNEQGARERAKADFCSLEEAMQITVSRANRLLTKGEKTEGHYFFDLRIHDETVGQAWLHVDSSTQLAWLYFIVIRPEHRQKGFGAQAITALKRHARERGATVFWLNVMADNQAARRLYESAGLTTQALHMNCQLS